MDRNEEGNSSATYRISSPTNADGAKRSPEKLNASALRKNSSGKLQNPNSSKHLINVCYVNNGPIKSKPENGLFVFEMDFNIKLG